MLLGLVGEAEVQGGRGQQVDAGIVTLVVVAGEDALAEGAGMVNGAEAVRRLGTVFQGAAVTFRGRTVAGDMQTGACLGDAEVGGRGLQERGTCR